MHPIVFLLNSSGAYHEALIHAHALRLVLAFEKLLYALFNLCSTGWKGYNSVLEMMQQLSIQQAFSHYEGAESRVAR